MIVMSIYTFLQLPELYNTPISGITEVLSAWKIHVPVQLKYDPYTAESTSLAQPDEPPLHS
jgi:hypothetical protein